MTQNAYIFFCTDKTEQECLDRMLFGGKEGYKSKVPHVKVGDLLFLYNFQSDRLHGIFTATSEAAMNIEPDAWGGGYPWQVKVEQQACLNLTRADLEAKKIVSFHKGRPQAKVPAAMIRVLLDYFKSADRLPPLGRDYRDENPGTIWTRDGHKVRSKAEQTIDDWLYDHKIAHGYEGTVVVGKDRVLYDFEIPTDTEPIYIEFWGLREKGYEDRKQQKLSAYAQGKLQLIELLPKHLKGLDKVLKPRLVERGVLAD